MAPIQTIVNFMEIQRSENGNRGEFFIKKNDGQLALMTYKKSGDDKIVIDHTEVDPNYRGKGLGEDLVAAGVEYARENNLKIVAACPFAKKVIDDNPAFRDTLAE
jgi:predicted GNAT family acetyltransferase